MSLDFSNLAFDSFNSKATPLKFSFLNNLDLDNDVINRLSLNLKSIVSGSEDVFLTPIGKDNDPNSLLSDLDSLFDNNKHKINVNLHNLEQSNKLKFGPRSICKPWSARSASLLDYFKHQDDQHNSQFCVPTNYARMSNLRPLSFSSASSYLKPNTNSGLPWYTRKSKIVESLVNDSRYFLDRKDPCVLFTRTQEAGKTRNVWGYPSADTCNEMRFYQPLLSFQKSQKWRTALLGPDKVDEVVTLIMNRGRASNLKFCSVDFSSFDASVGKNLQTNSFSLIKNLFQKQFHSEIDYIADRFNTIGIITPSGVISGYHGVPSGATFTNEVDSFSQYILAYKSQIINEDLFQIQGDDGLYAIKEGDYDTLIDSFSKGGLNVNVEKSSFSGDHCIYLQRLYDYNYTTRNGLIGGIYSLYRALNRIIYQERYSDFMDYSLSGKDYYSIRTICILENCKYHPLFKEFVGYILKMDKYHLKFDNAALDKYYRMSSNGSGTLGFLNNQFGDNVKGLNNFATVKLIKEMGSSGNVT